MKIGFALIALIFLLTGCVSATKFDEKISEVKSCLEQSEKDVREWQNKYDSLQTDLDESLDAQYKFEADLNKALEERDSCRKNYEEAQKYAQDIKYLADALRHSMQKEIREKNVEIETLKGKLSVRLLDRILFKSGSAQILDEGKSILDKIATALQENKSYIRIEGHTDTVPIGEKLKAKYFSNWELSAARAASVVRYFEFSHKVSPLRMEPVGFSKYHPVSTGKSPDDLQRNRRVEIILTQPRK